MGVPILRKTEIDLISEKFLGPRNPLPLIFFIRERRNCNIILNFLRTIVRIVRYTNSLIEILKGGIKRSNPQKYIIAVARTFNMYAFKVKWEIFRV